MGRVPIGWTDEQGEEWRSFYLGLREDNLEGMPATGALDAPAEKAFILRVEERFYVNDPDNPPLRLQLAMFPRLQSLSVRVGDSESWPHLTPHLHVDESRCVVMGATDLEIIRWVQERWPKTVLVARYAPAQGDERDKPAPEHLVRRAARGESL